MLMQVGYELDNHSSWSPGAIKNISDECFLTAWNLLETRRDCLDKVAEELCEMETITGDRLREIIAQYTEVPEKMAVV